MPFNGSGSFISLSPPNYPAVAGQPIYASQFNINLADIFGGLSAVLTRDGQSPATANLPMGGNKHTGAAAATGSGQYLTWGQAITVTNLTVTGNTLLGNAVGDTCAVSGPLTVGTTLSVAGTLTGAAIRGIFAHTSGYFSIYPYNNTTYNDGSYIQAFWDGNLGNLSWARNGGSGAAGCRLVATGFIGNLTGNADTATALTTPRAINGVNFDGTAAITVPVNAALNSTNADFRVAFLSGTSGNVSVYTDAGMVYNPSTNTLTVGSISGTIANAATATALQTARNINGVAFDGTANITVPVNVTSVGTNADYRIPFLSGASGNVDVQSDSGLTYNPSSNVLTVTGRVAGNADTATALATARNLNGASFNGTANITVPTNVVTDATAANQYVLFAAASGNVESRVNSGIRFDPSTNTLSVSGEILTASNTPTGDYSVGFRKVPRNTSATISRLYNGFCKSLSAGVTIPSATFEAGDSFSIYNNSASAFDLTQGSGLTMRGPNGSTGTLSLAAYGMAVLWFDSASVVKVMGEVS